MKGLQPTSAFCSRTSTFYKLSIYIYLFMVCRTNKNTALIFAEKQFYYWYTLVDIYIPLQIGQHCPGSVRVCPDFPEQSSLGHGGGEHTFFPL